MITLYITCLFHGDDPLGDEVAGAVLVYVLPELAGEAALVEGEVGAPLVHEVHESAQRFSGSVSLSALAVNGLGKLKVCLLYCQE